MLEMNKNLYNAFVRCNQRLETDGVNENRTWDVVVRVCEHTPSPSSISPRIVDLNELIFYIIMLCCDNTQQLLRIAVAIFEIRIQILKIRKFRGGAAKINFRRSLV